MMTDVFCTLFSSDSDATIVSKAYIFAAFLLIFAAGLAIGSFLNVVIYRLPRGKSLCLPASHCTACNTPILWYDNIPVLSYLLLHGRCRSCGARISFRYPLVELLNAVGWVLSALVFFTEPFCALISAITASVLITVAFIDLDFMLIFNRAWICITLLGAALMHFDGYTAHYDHIIGLLFAAALFFGAYYISRAILGHEGLGFGDVKLACAAGFLLGWQRFLLAVIASSVTASIILLILRKSRGDERGREYPFGPYLAFGIFFAMLFGEWIINAYVTALLSI